MPTDWRSPLLHHDWLGPLWRYRDEALIGSIPIDPTIRPARMNGEMDAEVFLELGYVEPGPDLEAQVSTAVERMKSALANLAEIRVFGVEHAPSAWRNHHEALGGLPLVERLFLDGFEVDDTLVVSACFDFGDLDTLVVRLDDVSQGRSVELRP